MHVFRGSGAHVCICLRGLKHNFRCFSRYHSSFLSLDLCNSMVCNSSIRLKYQLISESQRFTCLCFYLMGRAKRTLSYQERGQQAPGTSSKTRIFESCFSLGLWGDNWLFHDNTYLLHQTMSFLMIWCPVLRGMTEAPDLTQVSSLGQISDCGQYVWEANV